MLREDRPWGHYEVLDQGEGWQVKRLVVEPGESFSLQYHSKRSEYWKVVQGEGIAEIDRWSHRVDSTGSCLIVPVGVVHRLTNVGIIPLVVVEVQQGEYLGEDDITRLEDQYGRE